MKLPKIVYGVVFASLAMMLPVLLPAHAEKLAQNTIEISSRESAPHEQGKEPEHLNGRDHDSEKNDDLESGDDSDRNSKEHDHEDQKR